jgi:hypothetical protein
MRAIVEQSTADMPKEISKSPKFVRVHVSLTEGHYNELKAAAAEAGVDASDFVRSALRLYAFLQKERLRGKSVYIGQDDKPEKEIVFVGTD